MIIVNVVMGRAGTDDYQRAEAAANTVLEQRQVAPERAYRDYLEQVAQMNEYGFIVDGDRRLHELHGAALAWSDAASAANHALTTGWLNPDGAACEIELAGGAA